MICGQIVLKEFKKYISMFRANFVEKIGDDKIQGVFNKKGRGRNLHLSHCYLRVGNKTLWRHLLSYRYESNLFGEGDSLV